METGWYEWSLRELARYFFAVGILALVLFVLLQMKLSWLPSDAPPILDPRLVAVLALITIIVIGVLAAFVYRYVWSNEGWVARKLARHSGATLNRTERDPSDTNRP